jgi:hypothetical protein
LSSNFYEAKKSYAERVKECRIAVQRFLLTLWNNYGGFGNTEFKDSQVEEDVRDKISILAIFVAKARGQLKIWELRDSDGEFEHEPPRIEDPERIMALLLNIAKGFALVSGRNQVTLDDYEALKKIALSSMPQARYTLVSYMLNNGGVVGTVDDDELGITYKMLSRGIHELVALGMADFEIKKEKKPKTGILALDKSAFGRPVLKIKLKQEFMLA